MLKVKDLVYEVAGVNAMKSQPISLSLGSGEVLLIQGASGIGKTTLVEVLCGLRKKTSGRVAIRGPIGLAPQDDVLYPSMTIRDQLELIARFRGIAKGDRSEIVGREAERFGFPAILDKRPDVLSGGEKKRAVLARAIIGRPDLIILDEAFVGLDAAAVDECVRAFLSATAKWKPGVIVIEHKQTMLSAQATQTLDLEQYF